MAGTVARLPAVRRSGFPLDGRRKWHHVFRTMKTIRLLTTLCAALVATPAGLLAAEAPWTADFAAAKKEAAASDKDLLIDFTGSDWCGWCIKLTKEVFSHDEFKEGVKDKFVLVELDFPQDKSKLPEETQKQNEKLGAEYAVQGYPTILLTDAEGRPYAATGYQKGGPEAYLKHHPLDVGAEHEEFLVDVLVAAVDVIEAADSESVEPLNPARAGSVRSFSSRAASTRAAEARRSDAITGAAESFSTPRTTAVP
jgi:thioredoxin-related protein